MHIILEQHGKGGAIMATSSITKTFTIKDSEAYTRFMKLQEEPVAEQPRQTTKRLEEGIEKLKQFSFHSKN